jgi:hypothetical protein
MSGTRGYRGGHGFFRLPTHSRFTCFNSPLLFVTDSRGLRNLGVGILAYPGTVVCLFSYVQRQTIRSPENNDGIFPLDRQAVLTPKEKSFVIWTNTRNVDHFYRPHDRNLIPNFQSTIILPWERETPRIPSYQVGPSRLAGNAWSVHHANAMVLVSNPLPLAWLHLLGVYSWTVMGRKCPVDGDRPFFPSL